MFTACESPYTPGHFVSQETPFLRLAPKTFALRVAVSKLEFDAKVHMETMDFCALRRARPIGNQPPRTPPARDGFTWTCRAVMPQPGLYVILNCRRPQEFCARRFSLRRVPSQGQVGERLKPTDCKSVRPCGVRRFESFPVHQSCGLDRTAGERRC
jgi:hypothetical protein